MIDNYKRFIILLAALLLCIFLIYISSVNYGIGLSPDSTHYISISKNIIPDHSIVSSITEWDIVGEKSWNALWPPLYPLFIIIPVLLHNYFKEIPFVILNGILLFVTIFLTGMLLKRLVKTDKIIYLLSIILIIFSKWLFWIFCFIWSETLFIPLVIVYLLLFDNFIKSKSDRDYYFLLISIAALSMTRYIGIFFFIPLFYYVCRTHFLFNLRRVIFFIAAGIPFLIYILMNYYYTKTIFGYRSNSENSWFDLAYRLIEGINLWIFGYRPPIVLEYFIGSFFIIIIGFLLLRIWKINNEFYKIILISCGLLIIAVFVFASSSNVDKINFRFFSPVFIPLSILIISSILSIFKKKYAVIIILILTISSGFVTARSVFIYRTNGIGCFSAVEWKNSEIIGFIKNHKPDKIIYSNYPDAINYFTNEPAKLITGDLDKVPEMIKKIRSEKGMLVLLNKTTFRIVADLKIISGMLGNQKSLRFSDGTIYFFD